MSNEAFVLSAALRGPVDGYLDAVDLALLQAEVGRQQRGGIVADAEAQLLEMIRETSTGRPATEADVAAVLLKMDKPEAYAWDITHPRKAGLRHPRRLLPTQAWWAAGLLVCGFLGTCVLMIFAENMGRHEPSEILLLMIAGTPVTLMIALGSTLGYAAWKQMRKYPERYWGRPVAVVEMSAIVVLFLAASPLLVFAVGLGIAMILVLQHLYGVRQRLARWLAEF